jgi:hypothetical protein
LKPSAEDNAMTTIEAVNAEPPLRGIRGWLLVLAIGQVLSLLVSFINFVDYYTVATNLHAFQTIPIAAIGELVLHLGVFTVIIYTTVALFGHKRTFRAAYTAQAIAVGSFLLVDLLWVLATTQVVHPDMLGKAVAKAWTTAIAVAIGSAPWLAYIYRSRRVANTFNR